MATHHIVPPDTGGGGGGGGAAADALAMVDGVTHALDRDATHSGATEDEIMAFLNEFLGGETPSLRLLFQYVNPAPPQDLRVRLYMQPLAGGPAVVLVDVSGLAVSGSSSTSAVAAAIPGGGGTYKIYVTMTGGGAAMVDEAVLSATTVRVTNLV